MTPFQRATRLDLKIKTPYASFVCYPGEPACWISSSSGTMKMIPMAITGTSASKATVLTKDEVEDVLRDEDSEIEVSQSSGRPTAFGWTSSGERIAVVFEEMCADPKMVYPVSAYRVPPKRTRRGKRR